MAKNVMFFENGIKHEFTKHEMYILRLAVDCVSDVDIPYHNADTLERLEKALCDLKSLFLEDLD